VSPFELIRAEAASFPIRTLCTLVGVSPAGYYAWLKREDGPRRRESTRLTAKLRAVHAQTRGVYGARRMVRELRADGERVSRKRVVRLMRAGGLRAAGARRFRATTDSNHTEPVAPNLLDRNFQPDAANRAWVGDITYVWCGEGWCYVAVLLDLYAKRVVGWAMASHLRTELPLSALKRALESRRPPPGLVHHTDRGCQYASAAYQAVLRDHEVTCSMSRAGDCYDNAVAESFFASLKKECLHRHAFATRTEVYDALEAYIDGFYNPVRRHSAAGYLSPIDRELQGPLAHAV
jgi:putative transposase